MALLWQTYIVDSKMRSAFGEFKCFVDVRLSNDIEHTIDVLNLCTASVGFLNLVSLVRFQPGAPEMPAQSAFLLCGSRTKLPNRQNCRHFADETPSNASARRSISRHEGLVSRDVTPSRARA